MATKSIHQNYIITKMKDGYELVKWIGFHDKSFTELRKDGKREYVNSTSVGALVRNGILEEIVVQDYNDELFTKFEAKYICLH